MQPGTLWRKSLVGVGDTRNPLRQPAAAYGLDGPEPEEPLESVMHRVVGQSHRADANSDTDEHDEADDHWARSQRVGCGPSRASEHRRTVGSHGTRGLNVGKVRSDGHFAVADRDALRVEGDPGTQLVAPPRRDDPCGRQRRGVDLEAQSQRSDDLRACDAHRYRRGGEFFALHHIVGAQRGLRQAHPRLSRKRARWRIDSHRIELGDE